MARKVEGSSWIPDKKAKKKAVSNGKRKNAKNNTEDLQDNMQYVMQGNMAKSIVGNPKYAEQSKAMSGKTKNKDVGKKKSDKRKKADAAKSTSRNKREHRKRRGRTRTSWTIGMLLVGIQTIATLAFLLSLIVLGMLPDTYILAITVVLGVILLAVFFGQILSRKRAIAGKLISALMSIILFFASFYIYKASGTVEQISGGDVKIDNIVVVVLAENEAESIQDAADYNFGVQYKLKGQQILSAVNEIKSELGAEITTTEYSSVQEQAESLLAGETQAMIYNEAYAGVLDDAFEGGFSSNVKVIYSYGIETVVVNTAEEIEVENTSFSVYISGIDVYGAIETNSRSDVNILVEVNPTTHQILLVTTPRDYYVELPGISGGMKDKLTHAGIYGVDVSMATLDALYDTETEFYARVNFTSLVQMVDALGGIDVYSEMAFTTSAESGCVVNIVQGENHLNGEQALAFCRERKNVPGGDFQRGKNQQAVITAMIQKVVSPSILMGANELLNSVAGNVDTNMSMEQIQNLIKSQLENPQMWMIKSLAAEGTGDSQSCYSSGDTLLYVTQPNPNSVETIKSAIDTVENGGIFEDSAIAE